MVFTVHYGYAELTLQRTCGSTHSAKYSEIYASLGNIYTGDS